MVLSSCWLSFATKTIFSFSIYQRGFSVLQGQQLFFESRGFNNSVGNFWFQQTRNYSRQKSKSPVRKLPRDQLPVVAITGRPNVGKSSLFNKLLKRRDALVYNTPASHVTRDYKEGIGHFADLKFKVIDTSGLEPFMPKDSIQFRATRLTEKVVDKSDIIILVLDARSGLALLDQHLGAWLQQHSKAPIILVANKCENYNTEIESMLYESTVLGMGMPIAMSAESGLGFSELYNSLRPIIDDLALQRLSKLSTDEARLKLQLEQEKQASRQYLQPGVSELLQQGEQLSNVPEPLILQTQTTTSIDEEENDKKYEVGVQGMLEMERGIDAELSSQGEGEEMLQLQESVSSEIFGQIESTNESNGYEDEQPEQGVNKEFSNQEEAIDELHSYKLNKTGEIQEIKGQQQGQSMQDDKEEEWQYHMQEIQKELDLAKRRQIDIESTESNDDQEDEFAWDSEMEQIYAESEETDSQIYQHFGEVDTDKEAQDGEEEQLFDEEEEEEFDEILEEDAERIHRLVTDGWVDPDAQKELEVQKAIQSQNEDDEDEVQKHVTVSSNYIRIAIMGLPNVGKSTMVNQLLGEERCLTGPEPGLTRDTIQSTFSHEELTIDLIDTAGYMKRTKLENFDEVGGRVAQLTLVQGMRAMNMAHVVIIVIDGYETFVSRHGKPLSSKEIRLVAQVFEEGRGLVVAANKMDLLSSRQKELIRRELTQQLEDQFHQVKGIPVIFTSALMGDGLNTLMPAVTEVFQNWTQRISTARLNRWMQKLKITYVGTGMGSGVPKVRYLTQVKARPPTFVVMFKRFNKVKEDDCRHVRNVLREAFGFAGVPLRVYARDNRVDQLRRKFATFKGQQKKMLIQRLRQQKRLHLLQSKSERQQHIEKIRDRNKNQRGKLGRHSLKTKNFPEPKPYVSDKDLAKKSKKSNRSS
eukprot:TRINITY_DN72580_c0_g1_i10.p1 TRINITY_DN72580_c0_g1~~TRINITY_DN72580_c0_g1_i10.p1  ORF type:complete len:923 (+),score=166.36 TRINITY_DN72580_c0_g1_i10:12-2780(+)